MKVLLVSPNREHLPDPVFPIGLAYVAASLRQQDHEVDVLDLCFSGDPERDIREHVQGFCPDIVGISLRNIDDVAFPKRRSYLHEYRESLDLIRKYTRAPLVLGGSGFTIMPQEFMNELGAEYGIAGEGEQAFPELIEKIRRGRAEPGKTYRSAKRVRDIDRTAPDRSFFDSASYYRFGGMLNIQTKRGCPFGCIYCTYPKIEGKRVRLRDPHSVADEVREIREQTGARHFFIVDSIFNHPASHAEAVCNALISRSLDITWSCYANPAGMTGRLAERMAKAGCTGIEFGTDSLVDEGLEVMGKNFTFRQVERASEICRAHHIKFCHFLFVGAPGDDGERVRLNIERLDVVNPDAAVIMAGIRIFPDTPLAERAKNELGIDGIGLEPAFYLSKGVKDLQEISEEVAQRRHWVMPGFEINLYPRLQRKLREHGIKGSLWEELSRRR